MHQSRPRVAHSVSSNRNRAPSINLIQAIAGLTNCYMKAALPFSLGVSKFLFKSTPLHVVLPFRRLDFLQNLSYG